MGGPRIKGAAVREFLRWYSQRRSPEALRAALATLPPDVQELFDPSADGLGLLPSSWYDSRAVHLLLESIVASTPEAELPETIREGARFAIDQSVRGIYRFVLVQLTPDIYVRQIQRLWRMLHDTGEREIVMLSRSSCRSFTRDWPGHHPVLCAATIESMTAILEILGCRGVRAQRIACVSHGAPECVADLEWDR